MAKILINLLIFVGVSVCFCCGKEAPFSPENNKFIQQAKLEASGSVKKINFSGYEWEVRTNYGGPGPNNWDSNNVWVDNLGYLHLKISKQNNNWYCAEISSTQALGFGTYQYSVIGRIDKLDKNVVFGLFHYPAADVGPDGTNEIDIEFSKWGFSIFPNGWYTVWPTLTKYSKSQNYFSFYLNGIYTTHRYKWTNKSIYFQSLNGHRDDNNNAIAVWLYQPTDYSKQICQKPMFVMINLWLYQGKRPSDNKEVEIVISNFKFSK